MRLLCGSPAFPADVGHARSSLEAEVTGEKAGKQDPGFQTLLLEMKPKPVFACPHLGLRRTLPVSFVKPGSKASCCPLLLPTVETAM